MFNGFTQETSQFFWDLMFHNERPWFQAHKEDFERLLKQPFDALAKETQAEMIRRHPDSPWHLHVSRIYRDARRLFGRGPYKEAMWFTLRSWEKPFRGPSFWFELRASCYSCGMGFYAFTPDQMAAYRAYIDANPALVERLAENLQAQDVFHLDGEDYKRPKGDKGELLNPWYNKKCLGVEYTRDFGGDLLSSDLPRILCDGFDFLMPYYEFLDRFTAVDPRRL